MSLQVEDKFKIKTGTFKGETFTVTKLTPEDTADVVCADKHGDTFCFNKAHLDIYGYVLLNADRRLMQSAASQVLASVILETAGDKGGRAYKAWEKAYTEARENKSIDFENGILSFTSRFSNEPRKVTKAGCAECRCGNGLSYHKILFRILERYAELRTADVVKRFPVRVQPERRRMAA